MLPSMKLLRPWEMVLLLGALLFAQQGVAADCTGHTTIIKTQDLSALQSCTTYSGTVTIQSISISVPTNYYNPGLTLDGVQKVAGDIVFKDISIPKGSGSLIISAPKLEKVTGLSFFDISSVEMPWFPKLEKVTTITFRNIDFSPHAAFSQRQWPQLQRLSWLRVLNTTMAKISGWHRSLVISPPESYFEQFPDYLPAIVLTATDNPLLNEISLQGFSDSASSIIADIAANGKDLQVEFPQFRHSVLLISDAAQFSAPDMKTLSINSDLWRNWINANEPSKGNPGFVDNIFTTLDLPNVTSVGNAFNIANNTYLSDLVLPELASVENLQIQNNPELKKLALPQLDEIIGELNISGSFDSISLPDLTDTGGNLNVQSSGGKFTCSTLNDKQKHTLFIKGKYSCSTRSAGLSTGAKAGIGVGVGLAILGLIALCDYLWVRHRRRRPSNPADDKAVPHAHRSSWKELDSEPAKVEAGGMELHELEAKTSTFETASSVMELESPAGASELSITPHQTEFSHTYRGEKG